jgi:flagellin
MRIDNSIQNSYQSLSSGKRINSAADDAAGLAISQKLQAQSNGLEQASNNGLSMNDLANTADGALNSMGDSLQRIRELAVQASNGILAGGDKQAIQSEIDELKQSINETAKNTQFNTQKILDGTFTNKNIAVNTQGSGMQMNIRDTTLATLGIQNFDVTGNFDISDIDNAISKVSDARSDIGATSNAIKSAVSANDIEQINTEAADSRIEDADIAAQATQLNTLKILDQYKMYAQKQTMSQKANVLSLLG